MRSPDKGFLGGVIGFSLRFRGVVLILAAVLIGFGLYSLSRAKYDVFPEFAPPQVAIQTEAPGLAPEQVEVLVTQPVENSINGVAGIESLRSSSIQGLSVVTATTVGSLRTTPLPASHTTEFAVPRSIPSLFVNPNIGAL